VTVSFWHFMRNLRAFVSFVLTDRALDLPNELHDCELLVYATNKVIVGYVIGIAASCCVAAGREVNQWGSSSLGNCDQPGCTDRRFSARVTCAHLSQA
jgi:hypothetical protein